MICFLVALAGDHQRVVGTERGDAETDGFRTVADLARIGRALKHFAPDRGRIFRARIVVRHDDGIGVARGGRGHQRPLAPVAVAAAAEDDMQTVFDVGPERQKDGLDRIGRVRVIDIDGSAGARLGDELEAAGCALQRRKRGKDIIGGIAEAERKAGGDKRVRCLEQSGKRQRDDARAALVENG